MTTLLAIDTSASQCAVALVTEEGIRSNTSDPSRKAAQEVLPLLQALLTGAQLELSDVQGIAIASGPGSFTGLRIGVGIAQGLGAALEIPVLGISSLALMAWSAAKIQKSRQWLVAAPARDNEVYFAAYAIDAGIGCSVIGSEQVASPENIDLSAVALASEEQEEWGLAGAASDQLQALVAAQGIAAKSPVDVIGKIEDLGELALLSYPFDSSSAGLVLPNYVKEQLDYS